MTHLMIRANMLVEGGLAAAGRHTKLTGLARALRVEVIVRILQVGTLLVILQRFHV